MPDRTPRSTMVVLIPMADDLGELVAGLRELVARQLALALKAQADGDTELSEQLVAAAIRNEENANALQAAKTEEEWAARPTSAKAHVAEF